ncbi:LLM class flavin-dependent oxidoreductase [Kribbella sp. DT2]|uniref:LLM class flavin-dependent oxidoreductase n=1 Tax=Kribbella sp. DT2 TaxID=3393427 RepID=UPI003CF02491
MTVVLGIGVPATLPDLLQAAEQADRDGLDHVSIADHPYGARALDAYAAIGWVLARTERINGLVNVTNLPLRPAPILARTASTLAALSGGRLVLGLGAGGAPDRISAMGGRQQTPREAVDAFEEAMVLIRSLTTAGPAVTSAGPRYPVKAIPPVAAQGLQIWTGSNGPRSLAATGRRADGWIPGHAADWLSETYRTARPIIDAAALAVGRTPGDVATIYNFPGAITDRPLDRTRDDEGRWIGGSVAQWVEELTGAVLEHGAAGFTYFPRGDASYESSAARWAQEIAPAVRAATS